ncbi:Platelet-activating factor acetylhydrolase IB subunit gamma [Paragonimus heterotremus]|uniref:Platelet-activating factor acetylhydrolase IB subunit gamma n=1 Tax=Paragonimus heterotremus TaxID=100268 RepID=A0A8J4TAH9_9TREM|nr:Platelet-activating factor acetylhydrolase IB subunit gamma [Paragonimus heterotremus]
MSSCDPAVPHDVSGDHCWNSQHVRFVCQTTEKEPDVVFLGDSILLHMQFTQVYKTYIEPLHCVNFSISGDQTQNVLWRIENGELDGFSPKVIVVMIGSHNLAHTAEEVVEGIQSIVEKAKEKQPHASIIVMGLLPCGRDPNIRRTKHEKINKLLAEEFNQKSQVTFLNPDWDLFIQPDGTISHRDMYDYAHPTESGYVKLAEPLIEELQNSLQTFLKTNAPANSFVEET